MHFSIPETQELYEETTSYTGYKIYINGNYHCCLRYKQLHALHEQLLKHCTELNIQLPNFPPKRFFPLTNSQQESRRAALEHYLQLVGQDSSISKLDQFQKFFLSAQQETALAEGVIDDYDDLKRKAILEIHLMNEYQLQVNCFIGDNARCVLQKTCQNLKLTENMMQYFCLFMVRNDSKNNVILLRRLMDFESPYLSRLQDVPCQIMLRMLNSTYDLKLQHDSIVLNLLFIQTVSDIEKEWIIASPDVRPKLRSLQEHGLKKEYLELSRQLPLYGCLQFSAANIDYPEPQTSALISIGNKELSIRTAKASKICETKFRVTRMRCWRVSALHSSTALDSKQAASNLQLSFEYLMSKQNMRWITITSSQAMLMSVCLQQMVDELLCTRSDDDSRQDTNVPTSPPLSYVPRTGRFSQSSLSSSSSTPSFSNEQATSVSSSTSSSTCSPTTGPVTFLSQCGIKQTTKISSSSKSYAAVFFRNAAEESVHNEAFEGIGDDDL